MPIYDEPEYTKVDPYESDLRITNYKNLRPDDQAFFDELAAGVGMSSGQEYLDSRNGYYPTSTYYGDVPEWQRTPFGQGSLANKIAMMADALEAGTDSSLPPNLKRAVAEGLLTPQQAASYYWNNSLVDIRYRDYLGLKQGIAIAGMPGADGTGGVAGTNGTAGSAGSFGTGANGPYGTATTGAFANLTPEKQAERMSAWSVLKAEFDRYGLGDLVDSLKGIILDGASDAEMLLRLRDTDAYKTRFAANQARIDSGLRALNEADYIELEDQYTNLMRNYGLPSWYTETGKYGKQSNLEKFIANDVSPAELEDRIQLAVNRVQNGPQEVMQALQQYYPSITQGEVLAYILDPKKALPVLQRQINNAEIGAEAMRYGLNTALSRADELSSLGINQAAARQGYQTIGGGLERGRALSGMYGTEPEYTQDTAEQEVFGMGQANEAAKRRRKLSSLEAASFSGSSGVRGGALDANRAGAF